MTRQILTLDGKALLPTRIAAAAVAKSVSTSTYEATIHSHYCCAISGPTIDHFQSPADSQ